MMNIQLRPWCVAAEHLAMHSPDHPVLYFAANRLRATYAAFFNGFPGLVTYAVKANPDPAVLQVLCDAGMGAFDVASPFEIAAVQAVRPDAVLHYNNPVRSRAEIGIALERGVRSFSVDRAGELQKLVALCPEGCEVSVRFKLPVRGAAYDFGSKFGAEPGEAAGLMQAAQAAGFRVSLAFHPGTQCANPDPWASYIAAAAEISRNAGIAPWRLNVGGGFPSARGAGAPNLAPYFDRIARAVQQHFGRDAPHLLCEPGRAMVGDAMMLALKVKARDGAQLFLNDGIYGTLGEFPDIGVIAPEVPGRSGTNLAFEVFGPTCDSIDRLAGPMHLPGDIAEGDYLMFHGMGAYAASLASRFNGYGTADLVEVSGF